MNNTIHTELVSRAMKSARIKAGLLQEQVADALGVSRQTIINYEKHPENVTYATFKKLADLYGCGVPYFFTY